MDDHMWGVLVNEITETGDSMGTAASTKQSAEQVIQHAYIDWVNTGPDDLAKQDVANVGQLIIRKLHQAGYDIIDRNPLAGS